MAQEKSKDAYPKLAALRLGHGPTATNAVLNLLRRDINHPTGVSTNPVVDVNRFTMDKVSRQTSQDQVDSDAVLQLLPELQLVKTVTIGSILDPKSMSDSNLTFTIDDTIFNSEIGIKLLEPIEKFFKKDYKIDERLDLILTDCLFTKGSSVLCVLPENTLDSLVNGRKSMSMEAFSLIKNHVGESKSKPIGLLGSPKDHIDGIKVSLESIPGSVDESKVSGFYVTKAKDSEEVTRTKITFPELSVTDNFDTLKLPGMSQRIRELTIAEKLRKQTTSLESEVHNFNNAEIEALYHTTYNVSEQTQVISSPKYMSRPAVGHPLILPLPSEAVIPVFVAGRPYEHLGYFLLIDHNGYPVSKDSTRDFYGELQSGWKGSGGQSGQGTSEILRLTREAMGDNNTKSDYEIDHIQEAFNAILTNDLNNRLRNGMYDQEIEIGLSQEIQRIMLYRGWKAKSTQLVYVPVELMTYIAFDYNENGIGETLIARTKMLSTMRTTLLFAETIGGMRNAMGRKKVRIEIDPDDPDPEQTISNIQSVIMEQSHRSFPLAAPDPGQTLDALMRSGYDFEINANDSAYAQTKVEFDDYNTNVNAGNPELQDRLRRYHISSFGVPPEKVDPMSSPDFATSIVHNDLVTARVVKERQKALCEHLSKFTRVFSTHSSIIRSELSAIITANIAMITDPELRKLTVEELIDEFILAINLGLPAPDNTQYERQLESLELYERILDKALESYITPDMFPDDLTEITGLADDIIINTKALFIRKFMSSNNILPELNVLTEMDGNRPAFSLLEFINTQRKSTTQAFLEYAAGKKKFKDQLKQLYGKIIEEINADGDGGGNDFNSGDSNDFGNPDESGSTEPNAELDDEFNMDDEQTDQVDQEESAREASDGLDDPMGAAEKDEVSESDQEEESEPDLSA